MIGKLTKIIATIGPATDSKEKIEELITLGVNVIRFNFKHSDIEWHRERIERVNVPGIRLKKFCKNCYQKFDDKLL